MGNLLDQAGLNCAVIGASGGIGGACLHALASRSKPAGLAAMSRRRPAALPNGARWLPLDLADEVSIAQAAAMLGGQQLDLVIVASGILHEGERIQPEKDWRQVDAAAMTRVFAINTIGPALVLKHFAPLLGRERPSAMVFLSARVGSISDNRLGGWYSYRASKAALNQIIRTGAIELSRKNRQSAICGYHPGTVETGLSEPFRGSSGERLSSADAAAHLLEVAGRLTPAHSGKVFDWKGEEVPA